MTGMLGGSAMDYSEYWTDFYPTITAGVGAHLKCVKHRGVTKGQTKGVAASGSFKVTKKTAKAKPAAKKPTANKPAAKKPAAKKAIATKKPSTTVKAHR